MQPTTKTQGAGKGLEVPGPSSNSSFRDPAKANAKGSQASSSTQHTVDGKQLLYITIAVDAFGPVQHARKVGVERPRNSESIIVPKLTKTKSALDSVENLTPKALTSRIEFRRAQATDKEIDAELLDPKPRNKQLSGRFRIRTVEEFSDRQRDPRIVAKIRESVANADEIRLKQLLANFERVIAVHVACAALADEELMFGAMLEDADLQSLDDDDSGFSASPESRP